MHARMSCNWGRERIPFLSVESLVLVFMQAYSVCKLDGVQAGRGMYDSLTHSLTSLHLAQRTGTRFACFLLVSLSIYILRKGKMYVERREQEKSRRESRIIHNSIEIRMLSYFLHASKHPISIRILLLRIPKAVAVSPRIITLM